MAVSGMESAVPLSDAAFAELKPTSTSPMGVKGIAPPLYLSPCGRVTGC